jgi:ATP-dependent phosphofructokinase / diphosphate-dependent phosphofructokinase
MSGDGAAAVHQVGHPNGPGTALARLGPMRIGVLTGGGDCPGLNAVIRAVVRKGTPLGHEFVGFKDGWAGPVEGRSRPLGLVDVEDILARGGTILGSSRTNPYKIDGAVQAIRRTLVEAGVDALVAIGGEDTLGVAKRLTDDGIPVVGVPKTIDNDRTTAESHHRALVVEVMGRHAGWIALHSGLAGGANVILVPEVPFDLDQVVSWVQARFEREYAPIIVVAEGATPKDGGEVLVTGEQDAFGHARLGGVGTWLADEIERRTGSESRAVVLGHTQRGGTPTAFDRVLSTRFGLHAIQAVHEGEFGVMVALRGTDIVRVPLAQATAELKTVPAQRYAEAEVFFG